jgi:hypothetical protein
MLRLPEADPLGACCTRGLRPHMKGNFRPHRLHLSAGCNHMHSIKARGCRAYIVQLPAAAAKSEALVGSLRRHLQSTRRKQPCTTPSSRRRSLAAACGSNSNDHSTAALLGTEKVDSVPTQTFYAVAESIAALLHLCNLTCTSS